MFFILSLDFSYLQIFCDNHKKYVVNLQAIHSGFNVFLVFCTICEKSARGYFDLRCAVRNGGHIYICNLCVPSEMADAVTHRIKTENLCRFCGKTASLKETSARPKEKFKLEFERREKLWRGQRFYSSPNVCLTCVGVFLSPEMANRQKH